MPLPHRQTPDRILVVDDSPDNLFLLQATLEDQGYEILLAENGFSALEQVDRFLPDLILLDVMMPEMDGYEVTQRVRESLTLPFIPILLITAYEQSDVVAGLDAGADDFIRKPVDVDEVLARVRSLLRLKHTMDALEELARQREDFVSRLTHDLRTPLVAADRMLKLLQQNAFGATTPEMQDAFVAMIRSNQNLLQMVNTILEVYRHDAGSKTLNFVPCDLREIIQDVAQELTPLAQEKGLALNVDLGNTANGNSAPARVRGDRLELQRVLTNLTGNAIKFTDSGTVNICLNRLEGDGPEAQSGWVTVDVIDTGRGITPEDQTMLFERFRQGNHKRSGSGLGLYLSNQIVQAHHGAIDVHSQPGEGSQFRLKLPAY